MAYVTEDSIAAGAGKRKKKKAKQGKSMLHFAPLAALTFIVGGWAFASSGIVQALSPAFQHASSVTSKVPASPSFSFAVVDQSLLPAQASRQQVFATAALTMATSKPDWQNSSDDQIIADIGPDSVIVDLPVETASIIEPRADYVPKPLEQVAEVAKAPAKPRVSAPLLQVLAYAPSKPAVNTNPATTAFDKIIPLTKAEEDDGQVSASAEEQGNVPENERSVVIDLEDVPLPGAKPKLRSSRMQGTTKLAYAPDSGATETREFGMHPMLTQAARNRVAVYDISAAVVYMPNGERLEAHSGIGRMRDNPRFAHVRMNGPTPPATYNLRMRESRFHGVEAIRMLPSNGRNPHGRDGFLTHSYLLRTPKDSHGCVAFANYPRFLRAFKRGEVTKMIVVDSMANQSASRIASLF